MVALALLVCGTAAGPPTELYYRDGSFRINAAGKSSVVRTTAILVAQPYKQTLYHVGDAWVVWDQRGLTIRKGNASISTKLEEIATTPKLFVREQLLANAALIETGRRSRSAAAIVGKELVGDDLFLLARWEDSAHAPWLETLIRVDLDEKRPKPVLIGKFEGVTVGPSTVLDRLGIWKGQLSAVVQTDEVWGLATWDFEVGVPQFRKLGEGLIASVTRPGGREILVMEKTVYGTTLVARIDLESGNRRNLTEGRGRVSFLSLNPIVVRIEDARGSSLRTPDTGAELRLPKGIGIASTGTGVLTWAPEGDPTRATLFSAKSWIPLALWRKPLLSAKIAIAATARVNHQQASRKATTPKRQAKTSSGSRKQPKPPSKPGARQGR